MTSLESYFDLTLLRQHETLPEKSSNWLLREINRPTNQLELSRWALNWKRGGDRSIEIERARNFPCISWPERPSGSVSSRFEILSEQIFFVVMNCSSRQRREMWALNRAIFRNWARRDFSFSAWVWPACGSVSHSALTSHKLLITLFNVAIRIAVHWLSI